MCAVWDGPLVGVLTEALRTKEWPKSIQEEGGYRRSLSVMLGRVRYAAPADAVAGKAAAEVKAVKLREAVEGEGRQTRRKRRNTTGRREHARKPLIVPTSEGRSCWQEGTSQMKRRSVLSSEVCSGHSSDRTHGSSEGVGCSRGSPTDVKGGDEGIERL